MVSTNLSFKILNAEGSANKGLISLKRIPFEGKSG
jgi:hypothetical protein